MNRPEYCDSVVAVRTAELLWPKVCKWLMDGKDGEPEYKDTYMIQVAKAVQYDDDAFDIAKNLDSKGWGADADLVKVLDDVAYDKIQAYREVIETWVKTNNIHTDRKIGDRVKFTGSYDLKTHKYLELEGEIAGINFAEATFKIFCESLGHVRKGSGTYSIHIPYEKVFDL